MQAKASPAADQGSLIYNTLRNKILSLEPHSVGITTTPEHPQVWGVMMETVFPEVVVTLVGLVDGTTSLYFSTGNGILGSGNHPAVGGAARLLVAAAELGLEFTQPVQEYPPPLEGHIRFYLLTFDGIHSAEAPETDLQSGAHALSALYLAGQELLTQIRSLKSSARTD